MLKAYEEVHQLHLGNSHTNLLQILLLLQKLHNVDILPYCFFLIILSLNENFKIIIIHKIILYLGPK
ncbi:217L [Invertebrate iridescent virus Kaz2018]|nr:217L [Invertebrate iridescent virus Kaz2018]